MNSNTDHEARVLSLFGSITNNVRTGARTWEWVAIHFQRMVNMSNHLRNRLPIFSELREILLTDYITMGRGTVDILAAVVLEPLFLGVQTFNYELEKLYYLIPEELSAISPNEIEMFFVELTLEPEVPGILKPKVFDLCEQLAQSMADELIDVYEIDQKWQKVLSEYFNKLLRYSIVIGIYDSHAKVSRKPYEVLSRMGNLETRRNTGGINIPLGYIDDELQILTTRIMN